MSEPLPLDIVPVMAGRPFTRAEALAEGIDQAAVRSLVRRGQIRRIVQGVFVDSAVLDSLELRAEALAKVLPDDSVICRQTAAWLYGVDVTALSDCGEWPRLEFVRPSKSRVVRATETTGHSQTLLDGDVIEVAGLRVTWLRLRMIDAGFPPVEPQVKVRGYRVDLVFVHPLPSGRRLALEYGSDLWHSDPRSMRRDEQRAARIEADG